MKYRTAIILLIILGTGMNTAAQNKLDQLADDCDFFGLREELEKCSDELSEHDLSYWTAVCSSFFNDCPTSMEEVDIYLTEFDSQATDERKVEINKLKGDNLMRMCRYADAADTYKMIRDKFPGELNEAAMKEFDNNIMLCELLRNVPPQKIHIDGDHFIPYRYNSFNHILVTVSSGNIDSEFIFDTGANLSTIQESQAAAMGLDIIEAAINVGTSTNIKLETKLAVAKHFSVGGIRFENVVFLVVPDEHLSFPEIGINIAGVVGFPLISQMGEIRIRKENIKVPLIKEDRNLKNLCLEGLMPVVYGHANGERLIFTLDTGANKSELSYRYYERHKAAIEAAGEKSNQKRGGGGGMVEGEVYEIPDFAMRIGNKDITPHGMNVVTQEYEFSTYKDGNLGLDILRHFPVTVISFEHMFVDFDDE